MKGSHLALRIGVAATVVIMSMAGFAPASESGDAITGVELRDLKETDRLAFVLAVLDARDRTLENFRYKVKESTVNIGLGDGRRRFGHTENYEIRRKGDALWIHIVTHESFTTDAVDSESVMNWDGRVARGDGYPPYLHTQYHQCRIDSTESDNFVHRRYNALLGVRVPNDYGPMSMVRWLRERAQHGDKIEVADDARGSAPMVRVTVIPGLDRYSYWLDPRRGFMVVRFEYLYRDGTGYNKESLDAYDAEQVSGAWVPRRAIDRSGTSVTQVETERTFEVLEFSIGSVKDEDVRVVFPAGAKVVDTVQHIAYLIEANGTYKLLDLANPQGNILYVPPANPVVGRVDDAAKLYRKEPLVYAAESGAASQPWSSARKVAVAASVVVAMAIVVFMAARRLSRGKTV